MAGLNKTFCGAEPHWANACVGDNGHPTYWTYAKGFSEAANFLIQHVLVDQDMHLSVDKFIYPVCFNMRHSVELCLKGAIEQLQTIAKARKKPLEFNLAGSHDINLIWGFLVTESSKLDDRYISIINAMDSVIKDWGEVDPTGQTFRYPISTESKKHLTDVSVISFKNLHQAFNRLEAQLLTLNNLGKWLVDEYSFGTCTANLGRHQIWQLAQELPPKTEWGSSDFDQTKATLKEKYKLSANELCKAINFIKNNYEFAPQIGEYPPLLGIRTADLILFIDHCVSVNKPHPVNTEITITKNTDISFDNRLKEWLLGASLVDRAWEDFKLILDPEMLAGLRALFYFANDGLEFSEQYIVRYRDELEEAKSVFSRSNNDVKNHFTHILNKTKAVHNILKSLYFLKRHDVTEQIVNRYELETKFSWLCDARSYKLFRKPPYSGYANL